MERLRICRFDPYAPPEWRAHEVTRALATALVYVLDELERLDRADTEHAELLERLDDAVHAIRVPDGEAL